MTVALLAKWGDQPPGTLYNSDDTTEAAMVAAKVATTNLAGAVAWAPPGNSPGLDRNAYRVPLILPQWAVPTGIAPSGTVGANGAVTLGTALAAAYSGMGLYLYFPAGAVYSGSPAGSYWVVMSNTTAGTVYCNLQGALPIAPATAALLPVIDAGPGVYTGATTVITLATLTVPGGIMGANGQLTTDEIWTSAPTAGSKVPRDLFGGVPGITPTLATNPSIQHRATLRNNGNPAINRTFNGSSFGSNTAGLPTVINVNTAADWSRAFAGSIAVATDWLVLDSASTLVFPAT